MYLTDRICTCIRSRSGWFICIASPSSCFLFAPTTFKLTSAYFILVHDPDPDNEVEEDYYHYHYDQDDNDNDDIVRWTCPIYSRIHLVSIENDQRALALALLHPYPNKLSSRIQFHPKQMQLSLVLHFHIQMPSTLHRHLTQAIHLLPLSCHNVSHPGNPPNNQWLVCNTLTLIIPGVLGHLRGPPPFYLQLPERHYPSVRSSFLFILM